MTQQKTPSVSARISVLVVVGTSLLVAAAYSAFTIFYSTFARYMYVEDLDLNLDESTMHAVTRITPADKSLLIIAAVLGALGLIALISALIRWARSRA